MQRVQQFLNKYKVNDEDSIAFLNTHGKLVHFTKGSHFVKSEEANAQWCLLIEGLVGYEILHEKGHTLLKQLCPTHHYFVGTKHAYSQHGEDIAITFLAPSLAYVINNSDLQKGVEHYPEINRVYHIMKQHQLQLKDIFLHLPKVDREFRLWYLYSQLPDIDTLLSIKQVCSLLGYTDDRQYYKALKYYHKHRRK